MNTLTGLMPDLYAGLHIASRELTGFIAAASRNSGAERAAIGQAVKYPIAPAANVSDVVPAMTVPEPTPQTVPQGEMRITKSRTAEFGFVGEERLGLDSGPGYASTQAMQFAEGLRALVNEIESDLAAEAYRNASRAIGAAGTTPYASGVGDSAQLHKILADNGAPMADKQLVITTSAGASLRTNTQLTSVNTSGDASLIRQGVLLDLHGFAIRESGAAPYHEAGDGASFVVDGALAKGATVIPVDGGTGAIGAGDVVTFAGSTTKYVVTGGLSGGSFTIGAPGLRFEVEDNAAVAVGGDYEASVGFARSALHLAIRPPALPEGGDSASESTMLLDPRSGLTFEVRVYTGYRKVRYEVAAAWGVKVTNPQHVGLLLG